MDDGNRVLACHRWTDAGDDVVVVATLREQTWTQYDLGFPRPGLWREVFNSDVYDSGFGLPVEGSGGRLDVTGPPRDGFAQSATVMIPANGLVVLAAAQT